MIGAVVRVQNEEFLLRLETLPESVQNLVYERMAPLMEAVKQKVDEEVSRKFQGKSYPQMFTVEVERIGSMVIGALEFNQGQPYTIHVGVKGILANKETGFMSRHDVIHPAMTAASIVGPMNTAYETMSEIVSDQINEIIDEAILNL